MATKKTTSSPTPTNAPSSNATGDSVHSEQTGAANLLPGGAGTNSTDTPESESTGGADNTASPAGLTEAFTAKLVEEAGCADIGHVIEMAKLGLSVIDMLNAENVRSWPLLSSLEDPADAVPVLCDRVAELEKQLAFKAAPEDVDGKRGFILLKAVRIDNVLTEMLRPVWLTKDQHAELAAAEACDRDWETGVRG